MDRSIRNKTPKAVLPVLADDNGLSLTQRQYLAIRAEQLTDYDALNSLGLTSLWLAEQVRQPGFRQAYNKLFPFEPQAVTRDALKVLLPRVVAILNDALDSDDPKRQAWAVERLLKVTGLEKILIESVHTTLPADLVMAKQFLDRGIKLSPELVERLRSQGLIPTETS